MKKYLISLSAVVVFLVCCMIGVTAYADDLIDINDAQIEYTSSGYIFTGEAIEPEITVTYNDIVLIKDVDYTVEYTDNIYSGCQTAGIQITGIGSFSGTTEEKFTIKPKRVSGLKTTERTRTSITVTWDSTKDQGVDRYHIYYYDINNNTYKYIKRSTTNSVTLTGIKAGEYKYIAVGAVSDDKAGLTYGTVSPYHLTCSVPETISITQAGTNNAKTTFRVYWNKVSCTKIQLQYSTDKYFKTNVKTIDLSSGSTTKSLSINSKKTAYYVRMRAYRKFNSNGSSTTVYGSWSSIVSTNYSKVYATYSTKYVNNANRTTNLKLACNAINGTIIYPGETFSFNKVVGKRTAAKGYKKATIFYGATGQGAEVGGGICQVASTMFNTALNANMQIVERKQHSQVVTYTPLGRDAAIYWGSTDFKFKNNTKYPIKIVMSCKDGTVKCSFMVCENVSPPKVTLKVTKSKGTYTLKRYVGGKCNYTTKSKY